MAASTPVVPLQTRNIANIPPRPRTIEETYQKRSQLEHILLRPDTYIGSTVQHKKTLWVFENNQMHHRSISFVPGLYKIFDEILVNAADNKQRDPSMDSIKVDIDVENNCISVYNNGDGIPVEIHKKEKVYVPEMIFGHLLTSSNYDDRVKKTTGGRNGYGAKLTNIFSTEFVVETADGKRKKKYKQVFSNNMSKKNKPTIIECNEGENWTRVTFKPDLIKFNMTNLEDDVVALMKRRVIDLAGCLGDTVNVELNGQEVHVKSFADYVNLYLQSPSTSDPESFTRIIEKVNDRWEVCVCIKEGHFQQVSFVNRIATTKGGTHVDYVTEQIIDHVMDKIDADNKNAPLASHIKTQTVKNHFWVFINALIDNPSFNSQTKEALTSSPINFESSCILSQAFLDKVDEAGVVESLLSWADYKNKRELKKKDAAKRKRITDIPKLEDANEAGGEDSDKCTLILTEGDSAKALAMAGISVLGRNHYGVFPLRGKLLNVRDVANWKIVQNEEIKNIKKILGLERDLAYDSVKSLRYGHLMIMTDQDHDGSHIKGLLINFIHSLWPSLLKIPSFLVEFITPIVKATNKSGRVISFYSMPEYELWKESLRGNTSGWSIKYYKGLGTSTSMEGKEYFKDLENHRKEFVWKDEKDGEAIELAFSGKKINARKTWLKKFKPGTYLDHKEKHVKYSDFVNKELIQFSIADLQRSIPSMVDGLKPGQRKILFCSFKRNLVKEAKVAQFSGYVSEHSAYHHGEQSLASTIIGMAQDYVGSNNINLLEPNGQFGTRHEGGKDHASARYIYTRLSPITRFLFPKDDDILLNYLNEEGQSIEPTWYMPVIPVVLVNGSEGIGTGWSSYVPNYNPRDVIANVRRLLNNEPLESMDPWYKGFRGSIEKTYDTSYNVSGIIVEVNKTTLRITELPIRKWTRDYKAFLASLLTKNSKEPFIKDFREHNDDTTVHFEVSLSEKNLTAAKKEGLMKMFKLTSTISTSNMHLFDSKGVLKKYNTPEQILEEFFHLRLEYYEKRKKVLLNILELELLKLENKVRFIKEVIKGEIIVSNKRRADLSLELNKKGFTSFPPKNVVEAAAPAGTEETKEGHYDYLLSMAIGTLTLEKVQELCVSRDKLNEEVENLRKATPKSLWLKDLDALERELGVQDKCYDQAEEAREEMEERVMTRAGTKESRQAPKNPRKCSKKKTNEPVAESVKISVATAATEMGNAPTVGMPKGRAGTKKAPSKKQQKLTLVDTDNNENKVLKLKEQLAVYNGVSSLDQTASTGTQETQLPAEMNELSQSAAAQRNKTLIEISDDEDECVNGQTSTNRKEQMENKKDGDDIFKVQSTSEVIMVDNDGSDISFEAQVAAVSEKEITGKTKSAADATVTELTAATRKRETMNMQSQPVLSQELMTEILMLAESVSVSPDKKVRKKSTSPFSKKNGCVRLDLEG